MADYLKSIDPNHLIADPRRANGAKQMKKLVDDVVKNCAKIDIVKTRQYPNYRDSVTELWNVCKGKRPMIIDELQRMEDFEEVLEKVCNTGTSGGLLWSLMKPQYMGGIGGHALFHSYSWGGSRWPGFDSGKYFNERENLMKIREYGYRIRELDAPPLPAPTDAPFLYPSLENDAVALKWRCSPGSRYYIVERSATSEGPWEDTSGDLDISYSLYYYPMFTDSSVIINQEYYYRVKGKNESGISPSSNIIGPVKAEKKLAMDNLVDFSMIFNKSSNIRINSETWPRLRQTEEDFFQAERIVGSESGELVYKAKGLKSIEIYVFSDKIESIKLQYSLDGDFWQFLPEKRMKKIHRKAYPSQYSGNNNNPLDKYIYRVQSFPEGTAYVKILTGNDKAENSYPWIGRIHIGYSGSLESGIKKIY